MLPLYDAAYAEGFRTEIQKDIMASALMASRLVNFIKTGNIVSEHEAHGVMKVIRDQGLPIRNASRRLPRAGWLAAWFAGWLAAMKRVANEID